MLTKYDDEVEVFLHRPSLSKSNTTTVADDVKPVVVVMPCRIRMDVEEDDDISVAFLRNRLVLLILLLLLLLLLLLMLIWSPSRSVVPLTMIRQRGCCCWGEKSTYVLGFRVKSFVFRLRI